MNLFSFFGSRSASESDLPSVFQLELSSSSFVKSDILSTYSKILTDTFERMHGVSEKLQPLFFDNCVQSEASEGLITLLARAMADRADLFLVYSPSTGIVRKATPEEQEKIKADYKATSTSSVGVYVSFKNYRRTEMLLIYSALEYCVLASLNKLLNLSKAVQYKFKNLRASVSLQDEAMARAQAYQLARSLADGKDVYLDAEDLIELLSPDTASTEKAIGFLDAKRAYILGLPLSYVSGLQTPGIGSTGEADTKAVERGLKGYFVSILYPTAKALFGVETQFKSQDFRQINSALEAAKTFDLVSDNYLSPDAKRDILARMFELDPDEEAKAIEKAQSEAETVSESEPVAVRAPKELPPGEGEK